MRLTIRIPDEIELVVEPVHGGVGDPIPSAAWGEIVVPDLTIGEGQTLPQLKTLMLMAGRGGYRWNAAGCLGTGGDGFCRPSS